jgi:hypothetical protein
MERKLEKSVKRLRGYYRFNRRQVLWPIHLCLSDADYRLWGMMVALSGWDGVHHPESLRLIEITEKILGKLLHWPISKVSRHLKTLINREIISLVDKGVYKVHLVGMYDTHEEDKEFVSKHKIHVAPEEKTVSLAEINVAPQQTNQAYLPNSSLVSFSGSVVSSSPSGLSLDDIAFVNKTLDEGLEGGSHAS